MRTEFIEEVIGTETKQSILDKNIYSEDLLSVSANAEYRPEKDIYEDWKGEYWISSSVKLNTGQEL